MKAFCNRITKENAMLDGRITSFIDGRVRVRHKGLHNPEHAGKVRTFLSTIAGVNKAEINTNTGSLLLEYDPVRLSRADLLRLAESMEETLTAEDKEEPASACRRFCLADSRHLRRLTNRGMLLTLGGAVGFGLAGRMGGHVAFGWGFLVLNALHLYIYRKCL